MKCPRKDSRERVGVRNGESQEGENNYMLWTESMENSDRDEGWQESTGRKDRKWKVTTLSLHASPCFSLSVPFHLLIDLFSTGSSYLSRSEGLCASELGHEDSRTERQVHKREAGRQAGRQTNRKRNRQIRQT